MLRTIFRGHSPPRNTFPLAHLFRSTFLHFLDLALTPLPPPLSLSFSLSTATFTRTPTHRSRSGRTARASHSPRCSRCASSTGFSAEVSASHPSLVHSFRTQSPPLSAEILGAWSRTAGNASSPSSRMCFGRIKLRSTHAMVSRYGRRSS